MRSIQRCCNYIPHSKAAVKDLSKIRYAKVPLFRTRLQLSTTEISFHARVLRLVLLEWEEKENLKIILKFSIPPWEIEYSTISDFKILILSILLPLWNVQLQQISCGLKSRRTCHRIITAILGEPYVHDIY